MTLSSQKRMDECVQTLQRILSGARKMNIDHEIIADLGYLLNVLGMNKRTFEKILKYFSDNDADITELLKADFNCTT